MIAVSKIFNTILNKFVNRIKRVKYYLIVSFKMFENNNINLLPGHIAFFTLWSVVPFYVVWQVVFSFINKIGGLTNAISSIEVTQFLGDVSNQQPITSVNIFLLVVLVYLSSKSFEAIIAASNYIYGVKSRPNLFKLKLKSIVFTALIVLTFIVVLIAVVIGQQLLAIISEFVGPNKIIDYISTVRLPITIAFIFIVVAILYHYAPSHKMSFKKTLPGTFFTTISWITVSAAYSFYINHFADYNKIYNSFSGVIVLMVWIYLISYIFVIGLVFNATYFEEKSIEKIRSSIKKI